MKRSEALSLIWEAINELEDADHILKRLEEAGMLPPQMPAKTFTPNRRWGGGCSSRCNCEECNPEYPVSKWETEEFDPATDKNWRERYEKE